ncbi:DNA helicase [Plasmodium gonderi]|uniref:DNA helicase n=1 Tax=Plasmodium gonderi TaxID=77519 RepID=A0A1Y1JPI6_PLAGO|nr:DNA helicase [Plasmodium gonderi]GAW81974.1 DNA helicase [Plasmodium gonderi]
MRSKYFSKRNKKKYIRHKINEHSDVTYNIPISTSLYNTTILHENFSAREGKGSHMQGGVRHVKDPICVISSNHVISSSHVKSQTGVTSPNHVKQAGQTKQTKNPPQICDITHLETETKKMMIHTSRYRNPSEGERELSANASYVPLSMNYEENLPKTNDQLERAECIQCGNREKGGKYGNLYCKKDNSLNHKFRKIISINNTFNNIMEKLKLKNKKLAQYVKCNKCNNSSTILKEGKYGYFFICTKCYEKISKKSVDNFIFNEREKSFYKNKRKICFEMENPRSYRIHHFGNLTFANEFNTMLSEMIKEIITDLKKIKKKRIKYRKIIKYIYKINTCIDTPFCLNSNSPHSNGRSHYCATLGSHFSCNFSLNRIYHYFYSHFTKNNHIRVKGKMEKGEFLFLYNSKFINFIEKKKKKFRNEINKYTWTYIKEKDFFDEMKYLPLTWKPRKDYIQSGIFPFNLSKDIKKKMSFRRLSVNSNNYLCGCVFEIASYPLMLRYFVYKLFNKCFIHEIPKCVFLFFRHLYMPTLNKTNAYKFFLKCKFSNVIQHVYSTYEPSLDEINQREKLLYENTSYHIVSKTEKEKKHPPNLLHTKPLSEEELIVHSYNLEELTKCSYLFNRRRLRTEILKHHYMKKKRKIKKKIHQEIKNICLEEIKKKLPRRIQKIILPYQLKSIYFFKKHNGRILIADEMGLGKTLQSISIFYFYRLYPTLIVTPSSLKLNWFTEIEKFLPSFDPSMVLIICSSNDIPEDLRLYRVIIVSFDIYKKLWHTLKEIKFKLIIVDESHFIRTVHYGKQSQLTKLLKHKIKYTKNAIFLSGTPSINRPINIYHQIKYLINDKRLFCENKYIFGEEFCKKYFYRGQKIFEENLRSWEFHLFLKKIVMIRRTISGIFTSNFPDMRRFFVYLPNESHRITTNNASRLSHREDVPSIEEKCTPNIIQDAKGMKKSEYEKCKTLNRQILSEFFHVDIKSRKQEEGISKIVLSMKYIEENFPEKKKIIFCYHLIVCKCIEEELLKIIKKKKEEEHVIIDYVVLKGSLNEKEKHEKIQFFKMNTNCHYGIFTICAVSHGLDFTFCNLCFFLEFPVNFFHLQQCESRLFRKNQKFNTYVFYFLLKNGLGSDSKTWKRFTQCSHSTRSIIDGTEFSAKDLFCEKISKDQLALINGDGTSTNFHSEDASHKHDIIIPNNYADHACIKNNNCKNPSCKLSIIPLLSERRSPSRKCRIPNEETKEPLECQIEERNKKKKKNYLFEINTLTNRIHAYNEEENKKTNFSIEHLTNVGDEMCRNVLKRCATKFLQNYNNLTMNEKKLIEKKKCDMSITTNNYICHERNVTKPLTFERYIKNTVTKDKTYAKAYLENSFKGKFQVFYYQEYDQGNDAFKCLYCQNILKRCTNMIVGESNVMKYLHQNSNAETIEKFRNEFDTIKSQNNNVKNILICDESNLFCQGSCRKMYFLKKSSTSIRRLIYERDKGVCNICKLDCTNLIRQIKSQKYFPINEKIDYFIKKYPLFIENINHLTHILQKPMDGRIWHVDHILPVCKGGGQASFDNLQTLCTFCHKKKTKDDMKKKRKKKGVHSKETYPVKKEGTL